MDSDKMKLAELYRLLYDIRYSQYSRGITSEMDTIMKQIEHIFETDYPDDSFERIKRNPTNAGRKKRFSFDESQDILREYVEGAKTMKQLAEIYHCSQSTIHAIVGNSRYSVASRSSYYEFEN